MTAKTAKTTKRDLVQLKNPVTQRYVKIDRGAGKIISYKKSPGPYKGARIIKLRKPSR